MSVLTKAQMEAVYRRNCDMVYRICLMHLKHEQDALDAVSETFLKLFRKNPDFADLEHEKAWLIRTAINYCKDVQKSFWKRKRNIYDETTEQMLQSMQVSEEDTELLQAVRPMSEYIAEINRAEANNAIKNEDLRIFPTDKMCDLDGTQNYWGISYHIDKIEVRDNLNGLNQNGYQTDALEKLKSGIGIDEKWNLQPYERETVAFGDGYENSEQYVTQTETVTPKLVLVTMTIKNISYEDDNDMLPIANPLSYIEEADDHIEFDWREFERGDQNIYYKDNMPIWISDSEGGSWFYVKKLKKGNSVTLQLGYLVDEDLLDEMVMEFNFGDGLHDGVWNFIDMRSAAE